MTSRILYVPHVLGRLNGAANGHDPWLAEHPGVSYDGGQPVFATIQHATAWFKAALDQPSTGPIDLAAVTDASTYLGTDRRTRIHLHLTHNQMREPHRQVAFTSLQLHPDPRVLRRQFRITGAEAHRRRPQRERPQLSPAPRSGATDTPDPASELPTGPKRFAFASGYQLAYSNAWYATHARVTATISTVARPAAAAMSARADRGWLSPPPVPPSPTSVDPRPARVGPFPALAREWGAGLALGAAHGALHAAHDLRATLLHLPQAVSGVQPDRLDAALRQALATTVPVWADHYLAHWATGVARENAPSPPPPPSLTRTTAAHPAHRPPPPRPGPEPSAAGPPAPPPVRQPPPSPARHH